MQRRARHSLRTTHDDDAAALALVHGRVKRRQQGGGVDVAEQQRPRGIDRGEADVRDHDLTAPVARQQMPAPHAAERHREIGAHRTRRLARREVQPRGTVHRNHRAGMLGHPGGELSHGPSRDPRGARSQNGVHDHPDLGPGRIGWHQLHPFGQRERAVGRTIGGALVLDFGHTHRDAARTQGASRHPPVAAIVAVAGGHQHAGPERRGVLAGSQLRHGPAGGFHQHPAGNPVGRAGALVPLGSLMGVENGYRHGQEVSRVAQGTPRSARRQTT